MLRRVARLCNALKRAVKSVKKKLSQKSHVLKSGMTFITKTGHRGQRQRGLTCRVAIDYKTLEKAFLELLFDAVGEL